MKSLKKILSALLVVLMIVSFVPICELMQTDIFAPKAKAASDTIYRVTLTWHDTPRDLDSHLRGKDSAGSDFHIYYSDSYVYDTDNTLLAYLDVDDTDGYGPENVMIFRPIKGVTFTYFVYNYSDEARMAGCGAVVKLFKNEVLQQEWTIPRSNSDGRYWNVFQIKDGKLIVQNRIEDSEIFSEQNDVIRNYGNPYDYNKENVKFKEKANDSYKNAYVSFSKDWFDKFQTDNYTYNHELAKFCSLYSMFGYSPDNSKQTKNNTYINSYLNQIGFEVLQSNMNAARDEVNFFIAAKTVYYGSVRKNILFVGTIGSNREQWYSNFDPWGYGRKNGLGKETNLHCGFTDAMNFIANKLDSIFKESNYGFTKDNTIILFTGHSRGAATANLLAAKALREERWVYEDSVFAYTFATPNNTPDNNYNNGIYNCIHNIVNPEDMVTHVMIKDNWKYHKYGKIYVLPSKTNTSNKNYKSYLKDMNSYYKQYKADEYEPYPKGEKATYKIIKEFNNNLKSIRDFYEKPLTYKVKLFSSIPMVPYDFFCETLLPYVSKVNEEYGKSNMIDVLLNSPINGLYFKIIKYFANPDFDLSFGNGVEILDGLGGRFAQAHDMATYCSYMQSLSSDVVTSDKKSDYGSWNCPVDIEIYDNETNELVGRIVNNIVDEEIASKENAVVMDVDGDTKSYFLPSDGDYTVKVFGNDDGKADFTLSTIGSDLEQMERINYFDIDVSNDMQLTSVMSANAAIDDIVLLEDSDNELEACEFFDDVEDAVRNINVEIEGSGFVSGDGDVISGDYVELTAISQCSTFEGWYDVNDFLISNEETIKFRVTEDTEFTARFSEGNHTFEEQCKDATCVDSGWVANVCKECGKTEIISETDPFGHEIIEHESKAPTCEEIGWETYQTCSRCEYSTYVELPAYGHNFAIQNDYSNVRNNGNGTHTIYCANCDITGETEDHVFEDGTHTDPTCTRDGFDAYICTYCDAENIIVYEGTATGHKEMMIASKEPTCITEGRTEGKICSVCNEVLEEPVMIDQLGHVDNDGDEICEVCENSVYSEIIPDVRKTIAVDADNITLLQFVPVHSGEYTFLSLSEDDTVGYLFDKNQEEIISNDDGGDGGNFTITCCLIAGETYYFGAEFFSSGSGSFEVELVIDHIHSYVENVTTPATCESEGKAEYTCNVEGCDDSYTLTLPVLGHDYVNHAAKAPTCTEIGWDAYQTCSRCDYTTYVEKAALGHDLVNHTAKAPTCTEIGWDAYQTCSRCDYSTYAEKAALGHDLKDHAAKAPTCTEKGWDAYQTCSRCDYSTYVEKNAIGHAWGAWTKLDENQHQRVCSNDSAHIEKAGHTWDNGVVTKPATVLEAGEKTFTCTVCKATKTESISKLPQTNIDTDTVKEKDEAVFSLPDLTVADIIAAAGTGTKVLKDGKALDASVPVGTGMTIHKADGTEKVIIVIGDIDGSGTVTAADARLALRRAVGLESYAEGSPEFVACDVIKDNNVTAGDARMILRAAVGLEDPKDWFKD